MIRHARYPDDLEELHDLEHACHPTRTPRTDLWWASHPTLVVDEGEILAYACYSIDVLTRKLGLLDTAVHPDARGQKYGAALMQERLRIGRALGCIQAVGAVAPDNPPMRKICAEAGLVEILHVPGYYAEETPARDGLVVTRML